MIRSPGCCRPLNGLSGPIGVDFYPTSMPAAKFATEPRIGHFFPENSSCNNRWERAPDTDYAGTGTFCPHHHAIALLAPPVIGRPFRLPLAHFADQFPDFLLHQ